MPFGPIVAGQFYTANPKELEAEIDAYISNAHVPQFDDPVMGLISPHAGYIYSGPVAAHGFRLVKGMKFEVVVVIGLSHRVQGEISVLDEDSYRTPLGDIPIDRERTKKLIEQENFIQSDRRLFSAEHSIEVQLPFLQRSIPDLKVVLISMRTSSPEKCRKLAMALDSVFGDVKALFVASTDMSHFHSYREANEMDRETLEYIRNMDIPGLADACADGSNELCGSSPVLTLMHLFQKWNGEHVEVLSYMNSGDTAGTRDSVVGYTSVALLGGCAGTKTTSESEDSAKGDFLNDSEKKLCLEVARKSIDSYIRGERMPDCNNLPEKLHRPGAAFVSLHKLQELRGCVGQVEAHEPLWKCIREMAVSAATQDTRFPSIVEHELADLEIEVSVLSPMEDVRSPLEIKVGRDGLMISKGYHRGLLLPQVASSYNWEREEFLEHTCLKAGLPPDSWRQPNVRIQKFQAQVFAER